MSGLLGTNSDGKFITATEHDPKNFDHGS
jgi:hypothetical protein